MAGARFRVPLSRLLTFGGLTAASGSALLYQTLVCEKTTARPLLENEPVAVSGNGNSDPRESRWDDNWDMRDLKNLKRSLSDKVKVALNQSDITDKKDHAHGHIKTKETKNESSNTSNTNKDSKQNQPTATRHLIFVRHGQYTQEAKSDEDRTLTELGRSQAEKTKERLKSLNIKFDKIVYSTMSRATETADLIGKGFPDIPKESCSLLREGAPCPPDPQSRSWKPERWEFFQDGSRIEAAFRKYVHRADSKQLDDSHELIVCHGNVIRYFVCRALQFPPEGWLRMSIGHCGLTWITIRPNGRVSLRSLGDTGHLPPELVTFK